MNKAKLLLKTNKFFVLLLLSVLILPLVCFSANITEPIFFYGIRIEFILFALVLIGVALFHNQTFWVAIIGFAVIISYKIIFDPVFHTFEHFFGKDYTFIQQITDKNLRQGEWSILLNLFFKLSSLIII